MLGPSRRRRKKLDYPPGVCACLFYVGHVRVYFSLEAVGWR